MMLSLYKLEIFAAVVQEGSFSSAATRLYMTQPAVSQHVQDLEAMLGTKLFDRKRRGVHLTPSGETLYAYTRRILQLVAEAEAAVTDVENLAEGQLNISATPGISGYLLPEWVSAFRARYPNLGVGLRTDVTQQVVGDVLSHQADLGFIEGELGTSPNEALAIQILSDIDMVIVVSPQHEWAKRSSVTLNALNEQTLITRQTGSKTRSWLDSTLARYGVKPRIIGEFDSPEAIKQAIMSGTCLAILPDYSVRREVGAGLLISLKVSDVELQRQMSLIWDKRQAMSAIGRAFIHYLSQQFPSLATF